jgi:hypothetical protein
MSRFKYRHTSSVSPKKTSAEMTTLLCQLGAVGVSQKIDKGEVIGMGFVLLHEEVPMPFEVPIRWGPIRDAMVEEFEQKGKSGRTRRRKLGKAEREKALAKIAQQAKRTAWRIALDWLKVQVAFVEMGTHSALEVFLGNLFLSDRKQTLGQLFVQEGQVMVGKMLPAPDKGKEAE